MGTEATPRGSARVALAIGAVAFALYLPVLSHDLLNWDDNWLITGNRVLAQFEPATLGKIFFDFSYETRDALGDEYLPVRDLSILLGKRLWGDWAGGFLLVNALLYGVGVALFYRLLRRLHPEGWIAAGAALLYAVHPIHVESVAWASDRKSMLCLVFFMAALLAFERLIDRQRLRDLLLACLLFLLAMWSKYVAVVLPAFLVLRMLWHFGWPREREDWERLGAWVTPFAIVAAGCLVVIFRVGKQTGVILDRHAEGGVALNLLTVVEVYGRYVFNLFFPVWLTPDYGIATIGSLLSPRGVGSVVLLAVLVVVAVLLLRRVGRGDAGARAVLFWYAWFFAALLPFSQITPIFNRMTDRYLLLASMSFAALLALGAHHAARRVGAKPIVAVAAVLLMTYAGLTLRQQTFWQNSVSLWTRAVALRPESVNSLFQLSTSYQALEDHAAEQEVLRRLLAIEPDHGGALNNLGINLVRGGGDKDEAIRVYRRLVELEPANFKALQNLGNVLIEAGRPSEAIGPLERAIAVNPRYCLAMANLGRAYFLLDDRDAAREHFRRALACNPNLRAARNYLQRLGGV